MVMSAEHRTKMCLSPLLGTTHINEKFSSLAKIPKQTKKQAILYCYIHISLLIFKLNYVCMYFPLRVYYYFFKYIFKFCCFVNEVSRWDHLHVVCINIISIAQHFLLCVAKCFFIS